MLNAGYWVVDDMFNLYEWEDWDAVLGFEEGN